MTFQAVLFDWRGTLFHDLDDAAWVRMAAASIGRTLPDAEIARLNAAISDAADGPAVRADARADASAEAHRTATMLHFRTAGLDEALAQAVYELDGRPEASVPYPDTPAALKELKARGCRVAVVSDIHYDLRPLFAHYGLDGFVDALGALLPARLGETRARGVPHGAAPARS
jgi:putative hydrolase of the HAD superfamily